MEAITKLCVIALVAFTASSVHIIDLRVPSDYVLEENFCRPLILDCDYEFKPNEVGFVLKWYHNNHLIYQWIPPRKPYTFSSSKYKINLPFTITDEPKFKHRAIQLQPHLNLSGDWMCSVSSYRSHDRLIKRMNIIVPEKSFELFHSDISSSNEVTKYIQIICTVVLIYPEPQLSLLIDNKFEIISEVEVEGDKKGFFNKSITARVDKDFLPSPSTVHCILEINGTNYLKRNRFIYYDVKYDRKYQQRYRLISSSKNSFKESTMIRISIIFLQLCILVKSI